MGVVRNHCFVMFQHADKGLDLLYIARWCNLLDSDSSWLDGVNGILMQQELNLPKQDYWN
jgi:hypothetical protein